MTSRQYRGLIFSKIFCLQVLAERLPAMPIFQNMSFVHYLQRLANVTKIAILNLLSIYMSCDVRKPVFGFRPGLTKTSLCTYSRWLAKIFGLYYPCSEHKCADQCSENKCADQLYS